MQDGKSKYDAIYICIRYTQTFPDPKIPDSYGKWESGLNVKIVWFAATIAARNTRFQIYGNYSFFDTVRL